MPVVAKVRAGFHGLAFGQVGVFDADDPYLDTEYLERVDADSLTRAELDQLAAQYGIGPEQIASKAEVVEALSEAAPRVSKQEAAKGVQAGAAKVGSKGQKQSSPASGQQASGGPGGADGTSGAGGV